MLTIITHPLKVVFDLAPSCLSLFPIEDVVAICNLPFLNSASILDLNNSHTGRLAFSSPIAQERLQEETMDKR